LDTVLMVLPHPENNNEKKQKKPERRSSKSSFSPDIELFDDRPTGYLPKVRSCNHLGIANAQAPCRFRRSCSAAAIRARPCTPERNLLIKAPCQPPQPPSPCCGVRAATGPTIRSKSAFDPGLPWIGTCCATSSFSRLRLRYNTTALLLTFARLPPAGGGP
jgi:hypothetical protein